MNNRTKDDCNDIDHGDCDINSDGVLGLYGDVFCLKV